MAGALLSCALAACNPLAVDFTDEEIAQLEDLLQETAPPADTSNAWADDADAAHLGQWLFFDERLSGDGQVSCATCHDPEHGFADPKALSEGIGETTRNAPTLLGASWNRWQFWDGRADSQWSQALGPLENPAEHGTSRLEIAHLMWDDADLKAAYEGIFGALPDLSDGARFPQEGRPVEDDPSDPHAVAWASMTEDDQDAVNRVAANVGKAVAAYERQLIRVDSPADAFITAMIDGDRQGLASLSAQEQRGLQLFVGEANCTRCHFGPTLTNKEFHNIGLGPRGWLPADDYGRYVGIETVKADPFNGAGAYSDDPTGPPADKIRFLTNGTEQLGQYKTPTLRNVSLTAPYMHGGHFESLEEVIDYYSALDESPAFGHREESLVPLDLSDDDKAALVAFLESLEGAPLDEVLLGPPAGPIP